MGVGEHLRLAAAVVFLGVAGFACGEDEFAFLDEEDDSADVGSGEEREARPGGVVAARDASAPPVRRETTFDAEAAPHVADAGGATPVGDLRALDAVDDPARALAAADVRDRSGAVVGVVSAIQTLPSGGVEEVVIALDEGKTLRVTPPFVRYDAHARAVVLIVAIEDLTP